ncbi:MAG TPA: hypothetical protein VIZ62_07170 [Nitrososphaeraceae archaeon]
MLPYPMVGPPSFKGIIVHVKEVLVRVPLWLKNLLISGLNLLKFQTNCFIFIVTILSIMYHLETEIPNSVKYNISLLDLSINRSLFAKSQQRLLDQR